MNQVGPEAVAPLCAGVVACGMWHVGRGISGRAAVDDGMQRFSRDGGLAKRLVVCAQRWLSHPMAGKMQQDPATERASPTDGSPCTGRRRCHIAACHLRDQESVQWTLLGVALFFWCSLGGSLGGCFGWLFECGSPHMVKLAAIDVHLKRQPKLTTKKSERVHHDMLESRPSTTT